MSANNETVGFVGVGLMGHGMAKNIVEKGYPLTVIAHRRREAVDDLVSRGAAEASSLPELAERSTIIFLCLTSSSEVAAAVERMKSGLKAETVIVDCSTSDPTITVKIAHDLAAQGIKFIDAPLSRTPKEAWAGTLDCMVGADPETFERVKPVIETWAGKIVHIGGVGDGHRMKLVNNFISLGMGALFAEAFVLARKSGIPAEKFDGVIRGGRMDCGFYQTFIAYSLTGDKTAHRFTLANAYKDLRYAENMANDAQMQTLIASAVKNVFAGAISDGGNGPEDYVPFLVDYVAERSGLKS
ncbi:NAD(P)-dependent oxidoreductase [Rhizobium sp. 21-4511-3d]|jgi:3-hydroxyisobutyrate dehydrogenase-like beta-hydroxyacid dehydrogenase